MKKRHFEALAAEMALARPDLLDTFGDMAQWRADCDAIAKAAAKFNDAFDYDRFIDQCLA